MTKLTSQYLEKYDEALHHLHQPSEIKQYAFDVVTNLAASIKLVTYFDYSSYISVMPVIYIICGLGFVYFAFRYSNLVISATQNAAAQAAHNDQGVTLNQQMVDNVINNNIIVKTTNNFIRHICDSMPSILRYSQMNSEEQTKLISDIAEWDKNIPKLP